MATTEYQWQNVDHEGLLQVIRWCQNKFCLRDWTIYLDTNDEIPREFLPAEASEYYGLANIEKDKLKASMWIPIDTDKEDNQNAIEACIHEMVHILHDARDLDKDELLTRIISPLIYRLYCKENKLRIAYEK